jgi:protocatechuate 3,4-dioxygenase beta subunit
VREVRAGEDWLYRIDSLQFRVEGTWTRPPESIAARRAELKKQDPNGELDPRYIADLQPVVADSLEYAIDFRKQHLRYVENEPARGQFLHIWDGNELAIYRKRVDGYEDYSRGVSKDPIDRIFGSLSWTKHRPHSFWWAPADGERALDYMGRPQDFRIVGRAPYRAVDCYLLEFEPPGEPRRICQWYVGCDDHLLYGRIDSYAEFWTLDYREVLPGCRMPMVQGYAIKYRDPSTQEPCVRVRRDAKIVDVRVNEELPDVLFRMEWKEGLNVTDSRSGKSVTSKYVEIPPSLIGKPVPDRELLRIDPAAEQTAGKRILLCFADLNQRPSRRCVMDIATGHERLRSHGIALLAVDVSGMDEESLAQWKQEQKIPFAIGKTKGDLKGVRRTWGLRSLPWLILTNRNHAVVAEGFVISDLDARIEEAGRVPHAAEVHKRVLVTVVDSEGNALAGVRVSESETAGQYTMDAKGQFVCEVSDQVRYFYAVDSQRRLAEAERLEPGGEQLSMKLAPARVVSGWVMDPNGRPVAGAQIAALPMTSFYVLTNGQGEFDVGWLPEWEPGEGLCLMVRHVERNLAAIVDISRQAARIDIQLAPALSLSGRVTGADGEPVPGSTVSLVLRRWRWGCGTPVERTPADATGHFTISTLPQLQEYELHARAPGYATEELRTGVISVAKDCEGVGTITLARKSAPTTGSRMGCLRIRIVDENLRPVDATVAQIWRKGEEGGAHAEDVLLISSSTPGLYEIDSLAVEKYHALSINVEGFAPFWLPEVEVRKELSEPVVCKLSRGGTIEGVVTDEAGQPVVGLPVVINSTLCRRDVVTDPNGRFSADHLPDARYSVIVEPGSESPYATTVLRGGAAYDAKGLRIVVQRKAETKAATSAIGTSLWQLGNASLPLERAKCEGKAILLCLFDGNQRPSRNCVRQLGERAEDLETRGVIVVSIDVSKTDPGGHGKRAGQNSAAAAWHGASLPWLILTDRDHVVRGEGFSLDELDERVKQIRGE